MNFDSRLLAAVENIAYPGICSSPERCILGLLFDLYSSCAHLRVSWREKEPLSSMAKKSMFRLWRTWPQKQPNWEMSRSRSLFSPLEMLKQYVGHVTYTDPLSCSWKQLKCYVTSRGLPGILISTAIHEYRRRKVEVVLYLLRVPKWTLCFFIYSNSLIAVYF